MIKQQLLDSILKDPISLREVLLDPVVKKALRDIGVLPNVLVLHAPSVSSKKSVGLGGTFCGIRGIRHKIVTCQRCKKEIDTM